MSKIMFHNEPLVLSMPSRDLKIVLEDLRDMVYSSDTPSQAVTRLMTKVENELEARKNF